MKHLSITILLVFFSAINFVSGAIWQESSKSNRQSAQVPAGALQWNQHFTNLAEKLSPSVVFISTKSKVRRGRMAQDDIFNYFFGNPFGRPQGGLQGRRPSPSPATSLGSGFVINKQGYIVTNSHVVTVNGKPADEIYLRFLDDPETHKGHLAKVVGLDTDTDVAVVKLMKNKSNLKPVVFGKSSEIKVGESVVAIGNPYGQSFTVTRGIISALGRDLRELRNRSTFIQTDASINPGNSGGPLFNIYGEVIGINTAINAQARGIGFAVPIDTAKFVVKQLVEKGSVTRGFIGVSSLDLNPSLAQNLGLNPNVGGAVVESVVPGSPAQKAGLKPYDVIVAINKKVVRNVSQLRRHAGRLAPNERAQVKFYRNKKLMTLVLKPVSIKAQEQQLGRRSTRPQSGVPQGSIAKKSLVETELGLVVTPLDSEKRRFLGLANVNAGIYVTHVYPGTLAANGGIRPGDVLLEYNRKKIVSFRSLEGQLRANNNKKNYLFRILRDGNEALVLLEN